MASLIVIIALANCTCFLHWDCDRIFPMKRYDRMNLVNRECAHLKANVRDRKCYKRDTSNEMRESMIVDEKAIDRRGQVSYRRDGFWDYNEDERSPVRYSLEPFVSHLIVSYMSVCIISFARFMYRIA